MSVTALRKNTSQENIEQLKGQLDYCDDSVKAENRPLIEEFLISHGIFSLSEIDEGTPLLLARFLEEKQINKTKVKTYLCALKKLGIAYKRAPFSGLLTEIEECSASSYVKSKAAAFLMEAGVKSLQEVDCDIRDRYSEYLQLNIAKCKVREYLKGLDQLKLHSIKKWQETHPFRTPKITYEEKKIYLSYLPVYELASAFYFVQDKQTLIYDFSVPAPDTLKRQVFHVLIHILEHNMDKNNYMTRFILPLKWLYVYCIEQGIEDLEQLELDQIEGFRQLVAKKAVRFDMPMQIINNARKWLFLDSPKTNWDAGVWYLERFHFQQERMNPSSPIIKFSFLEVRENRKLLQDYIQYQLGISSWSIRHIQQNLNHVKDFLRFLDLTQTMATAADIIIEIEAYFSQLHERNLMNNTYNKKVIQIFRFFQFLKVKGRIKKIPFIMEYYLKDERQVHHDRSVDQNTVMSILKNLYRFPYHLRLMYLNLWCIGLRINEVCTLKGDAYYLRGDTAWVKVYQNKMRAEKTIPIPMMLYRLMEHYIQKNRILPEEYIFKSKKGKAYSAFTFCKQIIKQLEECGITCEEYCFRSHDYRHTVATFLYAHGASLQAVRDYLGHEQEEMTMQYVDYLPDMIEKANEEYFSHEENNLTAHIKTKGEKPNGK